MGAGASAISRTHQLCPVCFQVKDLMAQPSHQSPAASSVHYRPSSLEAWLQHWELPPEVLDMLRDFGLKSPLSTTSYTEEQDRAMSGALRELGHQTGEEEDLASRWAAAQEHARHLTASTSAYDASPPGSSSLHLWLESWRLQHLAKALDHAWNVTTREDVVAADATVSGAVRIGMLPLEVRRWRRAQQLLKCGVQFEVKSMVTPNPTKRWQLCSCCTPPPPPHTHVLAPLTLPHATATLCRVFYFFFFFFNSHPPNTHIHTLRNLDQSSTSLKV